MSNECKKCNLINCGKINKYAFLILIEVGLYFALIYTLNESIYYYYDLKPVFYYISSSFGSSLSFILFIIYTIRNKRKNNITNEQFIKTDDMDKISCTKKILWILLVSIIAFISIILDCITWSFRESNKNIWAFYFLFLSTFSICLLKYKLYKHHYISIIIIVILNLLFSIISGETFIEHITENYFNLIIIFNILFFSLELVLYKYLMFTKYIQSYEILFFEGIFLSSLLIISLIILIKVEYFEFFWGYFDFIDRREIIIFASLTIIHFIYNLFQLIIIDIFSPFHILLIDLIPDNIIFIFSSDNSLNLPIAIVCVIINIFMILIFVEFIELNFLGLSKMTKRNIELRARHESMEDDLNDINYEKKIILDEYGLELEFKNEKTSDENEASDN